MRLRQVSWTVRQLAVIGTMTFVNHLDQSVNRSMDIWTVSSQAVTGTRTLDIADPSVLSRRLKVVRPIGSTDSAQEQLQRARQCRTWTNRTPVTWPNVISTREAVRTQDQRAVPTRRRTSVWTEQVVSGVRMAYVIQILLLIVPC